jgi:protein-S-isoprenylcysteine O-methyltransferase Ste14
MVSFSYTGPTDSCIGKSTLALHRFAPPARPPWNVTKTLVAVAVFCVVAAVVIPAGIVAAQHALLSGRSFFPAQPELAAVCCGLAVMLMLWAALALAVDGDGTPLPFDCPRRLVIGGPYAWTRNPMMLATMVLGVAATLYTGSLFVLLYAILVGVGWHVLVRPHDERHLHRTFGRDYEAYQRDVRLWLPGVHRFVAPPPGRAPISLEDLPVGWEHRRRTRE